MKTYKRLNIYSYKQLFVEGKRQAEQTLKKGLIADAMIPEFIGIFENYDPTFPKNKYFEMFAKMVVEFFQDRKLKLSSRDVLGYFKKYMDDYNITKMLEIIEKRNEKIDLSKIKDAKTFIVIITNLSKRKTGSFTKGGLKNVKKDEYTELKIRSKMYPQAVPYVPFTWEVSCKIGSQSEGTVKGFWCTANTDSDKYWVSYGEQGVILVYIVDYSGDIDKWAIAFSNDLNRQEIFDFKDNTHNSREFEAITGFDLEEIRKEVRKKEEFIRSKIEVSPIPLEEIFDDWILEQGFQGAKIIKTGTTTYLIKTTGLENGSFIEYCVDESVWESMIDIDRVTYDHYENKSYAEVVEYIQYNIDDKKAMKIVADYYPGVFDIDTRDEDFTEWEENLENDLEDFTRMINRANEQSYLNDLWKTAKDNLIDNLEEGFDSVTYNDYSSIDLVISLSNMRNYVNDEYLRGYIEEDDESLEAVIQEQTHMGKGTNRYTFDNVYANGTKVINELINDYGIDG